MNLHEVEQNISAIYHWYAEQAPGVVVQEVGHLANLWAIADHHYEKERNNG